MVSRLTFVAVMVEKETETSSKSILKGKDPVKEKFTTICPYTRKPMVFLLDPPVSLPLIFMG